ncbi:MAG: type II toxin-antitoxin system Phd/YefM family antitoxin [Acidimicrobiales bacterium]
MLPRLTASKLRENVYRILDDVIETGAPVEIARKNRVLRITVVDVGAGSRLENLASHPGAVAGDPGDLVDIDWSDEWRP